MRLVQFPEPSIEAATTRFRRLGNEAASGMAGGSILGPFGRVAARAEKRGVQRVRRLHSPLRPVPEMLSKPQTRDPGLAGGQGPDLRRCQKLRLVVQDQSRWPSVTQVQAFELRWGSRNKKLFPHTDPV